MLVRDDYIAIIEEIRNIERISLDEYIDKKLVPLQKENEFFIETLYKDINYVLDGVDEEGDNDLDLGENGDFIIEDGDFKLTGYQTRLHDVLVWLHQQVIEKKLSNITFDHITTDEEQEHPFIREMQNFESNFLGKKNYTPEYKAKLDMIRNSVRIERNNNYKKSRWFRFRQVFSLDNVEIFPKWLGIGINLKAIYQKITGK